MEALQISYIQPYSPVCDIGGAYNKQVKDCQSEWICITDQDTCFLLNNTKQQIHDIVTKGKFDLYGCMTNRTSFKYQCVPDMFNEANIGKHVLKAQELHDNYYGEVEATNQLFAGHFLLFRKSAWEKLGGFEEKNWCFDKIFSRDIKSKGLMKGVYVLHLYRYLSKSPIKDFEHLRYRGK